MTTNATIQEAVDETQIDYNALDNTLGGQVIQAGFIAAFFATRSVPARVGLGILNLTTVGLFNAFDEDPRNDLTSRVDAEQGEDESVALSWGVLAGLGAGTIAALTLAAKAQSGIAGWLAGRGVAKPDALIGLAAGGAYLAAKQLRP